MDGKRTQESEKRSAEALIAWARTWVLETFHMSSDEMLEQVMGGGPAISPGYTPHPKAGQRSTRANQPRVMQGRTPRYVYNGIPISMVMSNGEANAVRRRVRELGETIDQAVAWAVGLYGEYDWEAASDELKKAGFPDGRMVPGEKVGA